MIKNYAKHKICAISTRDQKLTPNHTPFTGMRRAYKIGKTHLAVPNAQARLTETICKLVSANAPRIHIEIGFLALDIGLDAPVANVMRQRFHMPPCLPIEDDHARE